MFFFQYFWCCTQSGDQSQEDLIIFGYKTNRFLEKKESCYILLIYYNLLSKPSNFLGRNFEICQNLPFVYNSIAFSFKIWQKFCIVFF
jgi:hypothetical protein